jgi:hypothetical protein
LELAPSWSGPLQDKKLVSDEHDHRSQDTCDLDNPTSSPPNSFKISTIVGRVAHRRIRGGPHEIFGRHRTREGKGRDRARRIDYLLSPHEQPAE